MLAPGQLVGRYEVLEHLGQGGTSDIYRVRTAVPGDPGLLALKLLRDDLSSNPVLHARLYNEALMLFGLELPGVIGVLNYGDWAGRPFIVLEYLPGGNLADQPRPLPLAQALSLGVDLARTLAELHDRGIVHRDIKPHNVLFTADGQPKIADFGHAKHDLAKADGKTIPHSTETGTFLGTPGYAAPEQISNSKAVTGSADVYALGVLLYEQLTGRRPFSCEELELAANLTQDAPLLSYALPAVSPQLTELIARMLARKPQLRPTPRAVAASLSHIQQTLSDRPPRWRFLLVASLAVVGLIFMTPAPVVSDIAHELDLDYKDFANRLDQDTLVVARHSLESAAELLKEAGPSQAALGARHLYKAADLAKAQGHLQEAAQLYEASLVVWRERAVQPGTPADHRHLATCANELGDVLRHLNQPERALALYNEALHHQETLLSNEFSRRPQFAYTQYRIALVYMEQQELSAARKSLQRAWDLLAGRNDHPDIALYRTRVAEHLADLIDGPESVEYAQQAYHIGREACQQHPHSKRHRLAYLRAAEKLAVLRGDATLRDEALAGKRLLWRGDREHGLWAHELLESLIDRLRREPTQRDLGPEAREVLQSMEVHGQWVADRHVKSWQQSLAALDVPADGVMHK